MPNSKSAKKRLRQDKVRRSRNRSIKSSLKTQIKKVHAAVQAGDLDSAEKEFVNTAKCLDKAGSDRVIHKNTAARYKSRLQKKIKAAKTS
jgi:small subunit ribosomal protein S20